VRWLVCTPSDIMCYAQAYPYCTHLPAVCSESEAHVLPSVLPVGPVNIFALLPCASTALAPVMA
jgi:hypothetical protein